MTPDYDWYLECSDCKTEQDAGGIPTLCSCGRPWLVRYRSRSHPSRDTMESPTDMWDFRSFLPLHQDEEPVSLGEGGTPLLRVPRFAEAAGIPNLFVKDEGTNPTGSFKCRGLSAAVTRASLAGAGAFVLPTAGNAGVAASAYASRAGCTARVYAPRTTPAVIQAQIRAFGGDLVLLDGHIGDCGRAAREHAEATGAVDLSTLKEPYRIEGKKTMGLELAAQFGWALPDAIFYPTGGGTGLIGMWKAFQELAGAGWVKPPFPKMYSVQATGCAPIVRAFDAGTETATPWEDPWTVASGLRVPGPIGDKMMLTILRESGGAGVAVTDEALTAASEQITQAEGIDCAPEGGAALAAAVSLVKDGTLDPDSRILVFNTGAGWLYRDMAEIPAA